MYLYIFLGVVAWVWLCHGLARISNKLYLDSRLTKELSLFGKARRVAFFPMSAWQWARSQDKDYVPLVRDITTPRGHSVDSPPSLEAYVRWTPRILGLNILLALVLGLPQTTGCFLAGVFVKACKILLWLVRTIIDFPSRFPRMYEQLSDRFFSDPVIQAEREARAEIEEVHQAFLDGLAKARSYEERFARAEDGWQGIIANRTGMNMPVESITAAHTTLSSLRTQNLDRIVALREKIEGVEGKKKELDDVLAAIRQFDETRKLINEVGELSALDTELQGMQKRASTLLKDVRAAMIEAESTLLIELGIPIEAVSLFAPPPDPSGRVEEVVQ